MNVMVALAPELFPQFGGAPSRGFSYAQLIAAVVVEPTWPVDPVRPEVNPIVVSPSVSPEVASVASVVSVVVGFVAEPSSSDEFVSAVAGPIDVDPLVVVVVVCVVAEVWPPVSADELASESPSPDSAPWTGAPAQPTANIAHARGLRQHIAG